MNSEDEIDEIVWGSVYSTVANSVGNRTYLYLRKVTHVSVYDTAWRFVWRRIENSTDDVIESLVNHKLREYAFNKD